MRLTVVMPVRDGARFVERALRSLENQSRRADQVLVVVGKSRDNTLDIVLRHREVTVIEQIGNGLADARNRGLAAATGDAIAFLDADDEWLSSKTEEQLAHLEAHRDTLVVTGCMQRITPDGRTVGEPSAALTPSGLMARRVAFDRVGLFEPRFRIACDTEWLIRVRDAGAGPTVLPEIVLLKYLRPDSLSRNLGAYRAEMLLVARETAARRASSRLASLRGHPQGVP